jgi:hypothetical protein
LEPSGAYTGIYLPLIFNPSSGRIDVVEMNRNGVTVRGDSLNDLKTYREVGSDCSKVLVITNEGDIQSVIIFEDYR